MAKFIGNRTTNSKIVRISDELDRQIRDCMTKNNLKYIEASRDLAKLTLKLQGQTLFKEIRF